MQEAFKHEPVEEKPKVVYVLSPKAVGVTLWDIIGDMNNKQMLERLSGDKIVNGDVFTFRSRSGGGEYIDVNNKPADAWLDPQGMIGSGKMGGPTWVQWLTYYDRTKREIAVWFSQTFPELVPKNELGLIIKDEYKLRYTWGTKNLDLDFAILKRGNFTIIAGERGTGKTTYSFDMAVKNAKLGHKVIYISLEMDTDDIFDDFARRYSGITIEEEYEYKIPEIKRRAFDNKRAELKSVPNLTIKGLRRNQSPTLEAIKEIIGEYDDIDLIFIDNLDRIAKDKFENDLDRQKRITNEIMAFTTVYNVPVVLLHHMRKRGGKEHGERGMDDMSGSGKIADAADRIILISRPTGENLTVEEKAANNLRLVKARGYNCSFQRVFFVRGTFQDTL